jgi:hypothetical protein
MKTVFGRILEGVNGGVRALVLLLMAAAFGIIAATGTASPAAAQVFNFGPTNTPIPTVTPSPTATPSATLAPSGIPSGTPVATPSGLLSVTPTGPVRTIIGTDGERGVFVENATDTVVVRDGDILYLGGAFTEVQLATAGSALRQYLASIDVPANRILDWNPSPDAQVTTIETDPNTIYVGGRFTRIAGQPRNYIAAFDKATGGLTAWDPSANDVVYAIHADPTFVWVGGRFTAIGQQNRLRIASFNTRTGELDPFNPGADDEIYALEGNDNTLFVGGAFRVIGGQQRAYMAAIDKKTGQVTPWAPNVPNVVRKITITQNGQILATGPAPAGFVPTVGPGTPTLAPDAPAPRNFAAVIDPVSGQVTELRAEDPPQPGTPGTTLTATIKVDQNKLGFAIPNLADILTFVLRMFFLIAGLAALFYMLLGAFAWVTSGGDEEAVGAARAKITSAVVGVILIVVVLAIVVTLEQIVFQGRICFGLSCAATIPNLIEPL